MTARTSGPVSERSGMSCSQDQNNNNVFGASVLGSVHGDETP
jgi:hypothetical protein